jgi:hypothetical protein
MSVYIEGDKSQFISKNKVLALKNFLKNESKNEDFNLKKLVINDKDYLSSGSLKITFSKPDFKVVLLTEEKAKREELLRKLKSKSRSNILRERRKMEEELEKEKENVGKNLFKKYEKALKMSGGALPLPSKMMENKEDMNSLIELMKNPLFSSQLNNNPLIKKYYQGLVSNIESNNMNSQNISQSVISQSIISQNDNDTEEED